MWNRGQSAVEYLTIVALSLMILAPTAYYVLSYTDNLQSQTENRQLHVVGQKIVSTVNEVYAAENGSLIRLDLQMPESLRDAKIRSNEEIVLSVRTEVGRSDLVFFSQYINVTNGTSCSPQCNMPLEAGKNSIEIKNNGSEITITP